MRQGFNATRHERIRAANAEHGNDAPQELTPIESRAHEIQETFKKSEVMLLVGETGSGKTTRMPKLLLNTLPKDARIAITQPRRVAAVSVARYVAKQMGTPLGQDVGFHVRFEDTTDTGTRLNFMTDGILLRKLQEDPLLLQFDAVMIDEAHERSLNIDFTLGLLKRSQELRKAKGIAPIKIVVASATLEKDKFHAFFPETPLVQIEGRAFPITTEYIPSAPDKFKNTIARTIEKIVARGDSGDILVFVAGRSDIREAQRELENRRVDVEILQLHSDVSLRDQERIFVPDSKRRVILSTNIAETSVTVPNVRFVIDTGQIKQIEYDAQAGIEKLVVNKHTKSGCIQRAGRAGRVAPGICYRLYAKDDYDTRQPFQKPEILRSNLTHTILRMHNMGIDDPEAFPFIDQPSIQDIAYAEQALSDLGALDDMGYLTEIGKLMAALPLEPHVSRMVVEASRRGCAEEVCAIAACIGVKSVLNQPPGKEKEAKAKHDQFRIPGSDLLTSLAILTAYDAAEYKRDWSFENFLDANRLREASMVRDQLVKILGAKKADGSTVPSETDIAKSVAAGLVTSLMMRVERAYTRISDGQEGFKIDVGSVLAHEKHLPDFLVATSALQIGHRVVSGIQTVDRTWLSEIAPQIDVRALEEKNKMPNKHPQKKGMEDMPAIFVQLATGSIDLPVVRKNTALVNDLNARIARNDSNVNGRKKAIRPIDVARWYAARIGEITTAAQVQVLINSGVDLRMQEVDFVTAPKISRKSKK